MSNQVAAPKSFSFLDRPLLLRTQDVSSDTSTSDFVWVNKPNDLTVTNKSSEIPIVENEILVKVHRGATQLTNAALSPKWLGCPFESSILARRAELGGVRNQYKVAKASTSSAAPSIPPQALVSSVQTRLAPLEAAMAKATGCELAGLQFHHAATQFFDGFNVEALEEDFASPGFWLVNHDIFRDLKPQVRSKIPQSLIKEMVKDEPCGRASDVLFTLLEPDLRLVEAKSLQKLLQLPAPGTVKDAIMQVISKMLRDGLFTDDHSYPFVRNKRLPSLGWEVSRIVMWPHATSSSCFCYHCQRELNARMKLDHPSAHDENAWCQCGSCWLMRRNRKKTPSTRRRALTKCS